MLLYYKAFNWLHIVWNFKCRYRLDCTTHDMTHTHIYMIRAACTSRTKPNQKQTASKTAIKLYQGVEQCLTTAVPLSSLASQQISKLKYLHFS